MAQQLAESFAIPFYTRSVKVKPRGNLLKNARDARYAALHDLRRQLNCAYIAVAHHADDQAETVLLRLARGSGVRLSVGRPAGG